jgi:hypothetical protein
MRHTSVEARLRARLVLRILVTPGRAVTRGNHQALWWLTE